jgi:ribosomal small subunit protein bTHX
MGRGDRRSKRGKTRLGSFGKSRPKKRNTNRSKAIRVLKMASAANKS